MLHTLHLNQLTKPLVLGQCFRDAWSFGELRCYICFEDELVRAKTGITVDGKLVTDQIVCDTCYVRAVENPMDGFRNRIERWIDLPPTPDDLVYLARREIVVCGSGEFVNDINYMSNRATGDSVDVNFEFPKLTIERALLKTWCGTTRSRSVRSFTTRKSYIRETVPPSNAVDVLHKH